MGRTTVLVVEDESRLREVLAQQLREEGYEVVTADGLGRATALLAACDPGLALVDVTLPDGSGFELCRRIRAGGDGWDAAMPILVLSARTDQADVLRGFERGADDYVRKPFEMAELVARMRALGLRGRVNPSRTLRLGALEIDTGGREVRWGDTTVVLAGKEYDLLVELAREPGVVRTRGELLRRVWDAPAGLRTRTLDSHASRLRRKLVAAGAPGDPVVNVWGRGYRLELAG